MLSPVIEKMTAQGSRDTIVEKLQGYTSCDVSDGLCKLGIAHGGSLPGIGMWSPKRQEGDCRIVGPAYTVKYVAADDDAPKHPTHYIDTIPEGSVVFISSPRIPNAVYGGLMSTRAKYSGAVGTVIDGRFRDLDEHRDLEFPVFAKDIGTAPPQNVKVTAVNVPIKLNSDETDMTINPGDYIIADCNGVVVLAKQQADAAIEAMAKKVDADRKMAEQIKNGMSFTDACKSFR